MSLLRIVFALLLSGASAFQAAPRLSAMRSAQQRAQPAQMLQLSQAKNAAAATLASLMLANAAPTLTHAAVEPPAVVQQYGASMVADEDEDVRDAQKKFLEERQKIKQQYDTDVESTFVNAEQFEGKKSIYTVVVTGLVVIAFVAPMLQFFYYTGGD